MDDPNKIRLAIINALPSDTSESGEAPLPSRIYTPPSHIKALSPECQLVIGARGVGKSVWTAALGHEDSRKILGHELRWLTKAEVRIGYSEKPNLAHYPDSETFVSLMKRDNEPFQVWKAVIARWAADIVGQDIPTARWEDTVRWIVDHPEDVAVLMERTSKRVKESDRHGVILFDALDRLSDDWSQMDRMVGDLLRTALWLKPFPNLSAKIFLREDQNKPEVTSFPDSSKLLATKVELTWARHDLHGLLWQHLLNGADKHGERLREIYSAVIKQPPLRDNDRFLLPAALRREEVSLRALFERLAGNQMGTDKRRGVPYVWIAGHLADGQGRTSPRSFLAAIRQAAEDSRERYANHTNTPLHYESIKRGVQKASGIRVYELAEDHPWVRVMLKPLAGITVPVDFASIENLWKSNFPEGIEGHFAQRLPPQRVKLRWEGIRDDLKQLGVFETRKDGRIDMPDLYRVGFGLGRKGGVKPNK